MGASVAHILHRKSRRLLKVWDGGYGSGLEPEDLAAWIEREEAYCYGVDPDISCEVLAALIKGSKVELRVEAHRAAHSEAGNTREHRTRHPRPNSPVKDPSHSQSRDPDNGRQRTR